MSATLGESSLMDCFENGGDDRRRTILSLQVLAEHLRLEAFRLLVEYEPEGLSVDEIARALKVSRAQVTIALKILEHARLVEPGKRRRVLIYRARLGAIQEAIGHVLRISGEERDTSALGREWPGHQEVCGLAPTRLRRNLAAR